MRFSLYQARVALVPPSKPPRQDQLAGALGHHAQALQMNGHLVQQCPDGRVETHTIKTAAYGSPLRSMLWFEVETR